MDAARKKALRSAYQSRPVIGGVCCIRCSGNGRVLLQVTNNLAGLRNRFEISLQAKSCPDPALRGEFVAYGLDSFSFAVLEELKKGEGQTDKEFADELDLLYQIWREKLEGKGTNGTAD